MSVFFDCPGAVAEAVAAAYATLETEPELQPQGEGKGQKAPDDVVPPSGFDASRRNALRDGLTSKRVFPPELEADIERRKAVLEAQFRPTNGYESFLVTGMARTSAQYDLAGKQRLVDLERCKEEARDCWDEVRRRFVLDLSARLPKDPPRVAHALQKNKQGVQWLLETWGQLRGIVAHSGGLDDDQRRLAFDLLGVRSELRKGSPEVPAGDDAPGLAALMDSQISRLERVLNDRLESDVLDRQRAMAGLLLEEDSVTRGLRRAEATARRDFYRFQADLFRARAGQPAAPAPTPTAQAQARDKASADPAPTERPPVNDTAVEEMLDTLERSFGAADLASKTTPTPASETPVAAPAQPTNATKPAPAMGAVSTPKAEAEPLSGRAKDQQKARAHREAKEAREAEKRARKQGR